MPQAIIVILSLFLCASNAQAMFKKSDPQKKARELQVVKRKKVIDSAKKKTQNLDKELVRALCILKRLPSHVQNYLMNFDRKAIFDEQGTFDKEFVNQLYEQEYVTTRKLTLCGKYLLGTSTFSSNGNWLAMAGSHNHIWFKCFATPRQSHLYLWNTKTGKRQFKKNIPGDIFGSLKVAVADDGTCAIGYDNGAYEVHEYTNKGRHVAARNLQDAVLFESAQPEWIMCSKIHHTNYLLIRKWKKLSKNCE